MAAASNTSLESRVKKYFGHLFEDGPKKPPKAPITFALIGPMLVANFEDILKQTLDAYTFKSELDYDRATGCDEFIDKLRQQATLSDYYFFKYKYTSSALQATYQGVAGMLQSADATYAFRFDFSQAFYTYHLEELLNAFEKDDADNSSPYLIWIPYCNIKDEDCANITGSGGDDSLFSKRASFQSIVNLYYNPSDKNSKEVQKQVNPRRPKVVSSNRDYACQINSAPPARLVAVEVTKISGDVDLKLGGKKRQLINQMKDNCSSQPKETWKAGCIHAWVFDEDKLQEVAANWSAPTQRDCPKKIHLWIARIPEKSVCRPK